MQAAVQTNRPRVRVSLEDLKDEISQIRKRHPKLKDDSAFVFWFIQAFVSDSETESLDALTGYSGDKNMDAILVDPDMHLVHLVQGKFRASLDHGEKRNDVLQFGDLVSYLHEKKAALETFYSELDPLARQKFEELVKKVKSGFGLKMYYVTTGKFSRTIREEAKWKVRQASSNVELFLLDGNQVLTQYKDYLEGVAPAVPVIPLRILSDGRIQSDGIIHRVDPGTGIESWVFSMSAKDVGDMYAKAGMKLFARNVRGYLGKTEINEAMEDTIKKEPENFWYYNNGVTIVCDAVRRETEGGEDFLYVDKPQVINGQQTTRTLSDLVPTSGSVLVKVIRIPRHPGDDKQYDMLVNSIVRATNWQNHIDASDLVSNDYIQVFIERQLRKLGYQYIRKKMTKGEAKRLYKSQAYFQIDKRELAQAVGATMFDPAVVRKGREGLFEDKYYKSIFSSKSMPYYLSRYWLMRDIQYVSRGVPNRAYPKWLVLNFSWKMVSPVISNGTGERKFRYLNERYGGKVQHWGQKDVSVKILKKLDRITNGIFKAALAFYRLERGKGRKAKDISTFFQLTKLDQRFESYWHSPKNKVKEKVSEDLRDFEKAMLSYDLPE